MTQNIYDDEGFFVAYSGLRRSLEGLDGAPEWPTLRSMLPTMSGRRVVDLGCGFGWLSRWAAEAGGASVLGIDLSERMLARAVASAHRPAARNQPLTPAGLAPLVLVGLDPLSVAVTEELQHLAGLGMVPGCAL